MSKYLSWDTIQIGDKTAEEISQLYGKGYIFTRVKKGNMYQSRSIRIDLEKFKPNSENRRVLRKTEGLKLTNTRLPILKDKYDWKVQKLAKNYYTKKFGPGIFSANKIKELLTEPEKSNFSLLMKFSLLNKEIGYSICYENDTIMHYAYPFYNLTSDTGNLGMGMMLNAILYAKESGKKYIYLGSASRAEDRYKLQFEGLEWFDGNVWQKNLEKLKNLIKN